MLSDLTVTVGDEVKDSPELADEEVAEEDVMAGVVWTERAGGSKDASSTARGWGCCSGRRRGVGVLDILNECSKVWRTRGGEGCVGWPGEHRL